jgi:hypothetical protein
LRRLDFEAITHGPGSLAGGEVFGSQDLDDGLGLDPSGGAEEFDESMLLRGCQFGVVAVE